MDRRFRLRNSIIISGTSVLCRNDKSHQHGCGCCRINKMQELAKQTVVQMISQDGKMARMVHMVCTLHTVCCCTGYSIMMV